ncbi:hypothetical protein D9M69_700490 [compost metagenome]
MKGNCSRAASSGDRRFRYFCRSTVCMFGRLAACSITSSRARMRLRTLLASPKTGTTSPWLSRNTATKTMPRKAMMNSEGIWLMPATPPSIPGGKG